MNVKKVVVGLILTNCYLLIKGNDCLVVDPGDDPQAIIDSIGNLNVIGILVTHSHFDHIGALEEIKNKYKAKVYSKDNLEEKEYKIGNFVFEVIYTFGHTNDSITYYFKEDKMMFVGDFIFKESIGRYDLPTASYEEMRNSLKRIKNYPDNITIYPGHDEETNLGYEKKYNSYLQS
ncbi:MAG: MBL fold metallo-hydrolase [Ignavibacteriales bacterium]